MTMFLCDELIYIQMQKTGCTHIASILGRLFNGELIGKHNPASPDQIRHTRFFLSSIRNPWDWYLSLWTYGVSRKGALWERLVNRDVIGAARGVPPSRSFARTMSRRLLAMVGELTTDLAPWREVYDRSDDVQAFRTWLRLIHDPINARRLGEGYAETRLADRFGFMTHRYLYLCCRAVGDLTKPGTVRSHEDLVSFDRTHCYISRFVRQESLEESLYEALAQIRPLSADDRRIIFSARKTNESERPLHLSEYYDDSLVELVAQRDRLIVEKFDYAPPTLDKRS